MAVKKFSSAYYVVNNMDQAVNFYQDILGLDVKFRDGDRWTQFDVNGVGVALADPSEGPVPPGGGATVVLEVEGPRRNAREAGPKRRHGQRHRGHGRAR